MNQSIIEETRKAIKRAKDGVGKNNVQTISLPGLNEDQAEAVGRLIAAARGIALIRSAPTNIQPYLTEQLRALTGGFEIVKPENQSGAFAVRFKIGLENIIAHEKKAYEEHATSIPIYEIENALPFVERAIYQPKRMRIDNGFTVDMDFEQNGTGKPAAVLTAQSRDIALIAADLLHFLVKAHGYDAAKYVVTSLDGLPLVENAGDAASQITVKTQSSGESLPLSNYPAVLIEQNIYEQILKSEMKRHVRPDGP